MFSLTHPPPEFLQDPYPFYRMLYGTNPVLHMPDLLGVGGWLVTDHAVCASVLRDKHFGKEGQNVVAPEVLARLPSEATDIAERRKSNMLFRDPPDHTRLRALVTQAFTPRMIERLRPRIATIAETLLDAIEGQGSFDLLKSYALPLPLIVIAELLGVPPEDRDQFKAWSTQLTRGLDPTATAETYVSVGAAITDMNAYLAEVAEARRRAPREDLISDLVRVHDAGDKLSTEELLTTCRLILTAGHETTVNLIGNGTLALLRNPEALDALAADPSLAANAVEELLRYDGPVQLTLRFALEEAALGPHTAKRGDLVFVMVAAGNRDPAHFADPDIVDVRRSNANTHLALGGGIHYCLGATLARIEGQVALNTLLKRRPRLALTDEALTYRANMVLRGLQSLPLTG